MTFGPQAHPIFLKSLAKISRRPIKTLERDMLALWNSSYYFHGIFGLYTKIHLTNYFRFLCDADVPASWHVQCLDRHGRVVCELNGDFGSDLSVIIDLSTQPKLDAFGIIRAKVILRSREVVLPRIHATLFHTVYERPNTTTSIMAHNLHVGMASHGPAYTRISPGLIVPPTFRPHLLIASGCGFHRLFHEACTHALLTFINTRNEPKTFTIKPMKPRECQCIDLFSECEGLAEHIGNEPFSLRVRGQQFLAKPFIMLVNDQAVMGEHL